MTDPDNDKEIIIIQKYPYDDQCIVYDPDDVQYVLLDGDDKDYADKK